MSDIKVFNPKPVEAVQFHGSSTQAAALKRWISGEEYLCSSVRTRDIVTFGFEQADGDYVTVEFSDWVVRNSSGEFERIRDDRLWDTHYEERQK